MKKQIYGILILLLYSTTTHTMEYRKDISVLEEVSWHSILGLPVTEPEESFNYTRRERCKDFGFVDPEIVSADDVINLGVFYSQELGMPIVSLEGLRNVQMYLNTFIISPEGTRKVRDYYEKLSFMVSFPNIRNLIIRKQEQNDLLVPMTRETVMQDSLKYFKENKN